MSYSTSVHAGHSYGQYFTIWNLYSVFQCRLISSIVPESVCSQLSTNIYARSYLHKMECIQLQPLQVGYRAWQSIWSWAARRSAVPLCRTSAVYTSFQKEDSHGLHLSGRPHFSHCALERKEYAISWVKMKYDTWYKVVTGLSVTSFLQGSS